MALTASVFACLRNPDAPPHPHPSHPKPSLHALWQRRLLERLAALAASVLGGHVPVAVVALDAVGRLLEVLGEVPPEVRFKQFLLCRRSGKRIVAHQCFGGCQRFWANLCL